VSKLETNTPVEIKLYQKERILELRYQDGAYFRLPCEFLRVYSPSAEVRGHGKGQEVLQIGKEKVNIEKIEPVGRYAIKLYFDDGHHTGIFSWEYLYKIGIQQEQLWRDYLQRLKTMGHKRSIEEA
jgi:DUF971 family protein